MKPHWKKCKLGEVADVIMGQSPPSSTYNEEKIGLPFYQGVVDFNDRFVSERVYCSEPKKVLEANDILLSVRAPVGRVNISKSMCSIGRGNAGLRMKNGEQTFLYNLLKHYNKQLHSSSSGTVFSSINKSTIENLPISLPPLAEQKAIARILGSLDDKIELNRQMNRTLEEMAQAIFKAWFVDFEPFKDGNFINSELGMIPEGWRVERIGDLVDLKGGGTPSTKNNLYWENGIHFWTTPKDLATKKSPILFDTDRKITDEGLAKISSGLLPKDTFLLSSRAPIGYLAISNIPLAINQGYIAIPPNNKLSSEFLYCWTKRNIELIKSRASGTTFLEISKKNFKPIKIVLPPNEIMERFNEIIKPIFEKIKINQKEIETLTQSRDTLLPKLLSGEIGVN